MEKNETNNVSKSSHFEFNKKRAQGFDKIHKTKKNFEFNKSSSVSLCIKLMNYFHCFCYKGDAIESFIPRAAMVHTRIFGPSSRPDPTVLVNDEIVKNTCKRQCDLH